MKSLHGRVVLITREERSAAALSAALEARGARVLHWPMVVIAPPADPAPLASSVAALERYDWIAFTSTNAVEAVTALSPPPAHGLIAAIGRATAERIAEAGWPVDLLSPFADARSLAHAMIAAGAGEGARVLFPASAMALETLPKALRAAGAHVTRVEAYRPMPVSANLEWQAAFRAAPPDAAIFTSPSAIEGLKSALGRTLFSSFAETVPAIAIGATTAGALDAQGFSRVVIAEDASAAALAESAASLFRPQGDISP